MDQPAAAVEVRLWDAVERRSLARATPKVRPYHAKIFSDLCRAGDTAVALLVLGVVFFGASADDVPGIVDQLFRRQLTFDNLLGLAGFAFLWQIVFVLFGLYDRSEARSLRMEAATVVAACTVGGLFTLPLALLTASRHVSLSRIALAWPLTVATVLLARYVFRKIAEKTAETQARKVLIVGSGPIAWRIYRELIDQNASGDEVIGFVDTNDQIHFPEIRQRLIAPLEDLERVLMHTVVDDVLIALPVKSSYAAIQQVIVECEKAGVQCRYSPDIFQSNFSRPRLEQEGGIPAVAMKVVNDDYRLVIKRAIDILGAVTGLVLTSPLLLVVALAIKLTSPGPVLFAQERFGWRKRRFRMLKFRTMVAGAERMQLELESRNEAAGPVFKLREDPRITALGRLLRKSSIDELPQLINVLRGEMSLVGPRPLPVRDVALFEKAHLMRRFSVIPGVTGLWQVSGRSNVRFEQWIHLDLQYIDKWSLYLDLRILGRTIPAVFRGSGAC